MPLEQIAFLRSLRDLMFGRAGNAHFCPLVAIQTRCLYPQLFYRIPVALLVRWNLILLLAFFSPIATAQVAAPATRASESAGFLGGNPQNFQGREGFSNFRAAPGGRSSLAGWRSYASYLDDSTQAKTVQAGPIALRFSASNRLTYDSNINNSPEDPLQDLIIEPSFTFGVRWPVTRRNTLDVNLGLSYQHYFFNPEFATTGFTIDPGTLLDFRIFTGDFVITLYSEPSIATNPNQDDPALTNTGPFREFSNRAGLLVFWDWNRLLSTAGFERRDNLSLNGSFSSSNAVTYSAFLQSAYRVTPTTSVGARFSTTVNDFLEQTLNSSVVTQVGVFLDSRLTPHTSLFMELGLQSGIFQNAAPESDRVRFESDDDGFNDNVAATLGGGDYLQPVFSIGVANRLNRYLTHDVFLSRQVGASSVSNFLEKYDLAYSLRYRLNRLTELQVTAGGSIGEISSSSEPFEFSQYGGQVGAQFQLARDASLGLSYQYFLSNLDSEGSTFYTRQRITISLTWNF